MQLPVLNVSRPQACSVHRVIPEIDIWRAATLMLNRYGAKAFEESSTRADELAGDGDLISTSGSAPGGPSCSPTRRTSRRSARPSSVTWPD